MIQQKLQLHNHHQYRIANKLYGRCHIWFDFKIESLKFFSVFNW